MVTVGHKSTDLFCFCKFGWFGVLAGAMLIIDVFLKTEIKNCESTWASYLCTHPSPECDA